MSTAPPPRGESISTSAQYVSSESKNLSEKVKSAGLAQEIGFVQIAVAGKRRNTVVHLQKRM